MNIRFVGKANDIIQIEGYVNAIERKSKPLKSRMGTFVERICKGAFKRALETNDDVRLLLNHDWKHNLGGTKDGTLELTEDNIGLKARATTSDPEIVEKGRNGDLIGWSFGFYDRDVDSHEENGMTTRDVKDLYLSEVSILDRTRTPAYEGTLIAVRDDEEPQYYGEPLYDEPETPAAEQPAETNTPTPETRDEEIKNIDYSKYEAIIEEMKGE